jgi:hypothetical protein
MSEKIKFRDYSKYPPGIMEACHFRDDFDDEPDGAFFALAEERGLTDALIEMADWEMENTTVGEKAG